MPPPIGGILPMPPIGGMPHMLGAAPPHGRQPSGGLDLLPENLAGQVQQALEEPPVAPRREEGDRAIDHLRSREVTLPEPSVVGPADPALPRAGAHAEEAAEVPM